MSLQFIDSVGHYADADKLGKYTSIGTGEGSVTLTAGIGRRGGAAFRASAPAGNSSTPLGRTFQYASGAKCMGGIAWKHSGGGTFATWRGGSAGDPANPSPLLESSWLWAVRSAGTVQCWVRVNTDGTLSAMRGTTVLGTTSIALVSGAWQYVVFEVVIDPSAGTFKLWIDGISALSLTGQNTRNGSVSTWNEVFWCRATSSSGGTVTWDYHDIWIADGSSSNIDGTASTLTSAIPVDVRVDAQFPTAAGNSSQFTRSTGANQAATIDETSANGDTDYNASSTVGHLDTLAMGDLAVSGATVYGAQVTVQVKKTDAGSTGHKAALRIGSTDYLGPEQGVPASYAFLCMPWDASPATSSAFTASEINGLEAGYKKSQ